MAIILPYDVLRKNARTACSNAKLTPEQCMIELGVTNIVGTHRIDTRYDPDDPRIKDATYCQDAKLPCIEVKLEVSNWWAQPAGDTLVAGVSTLNKQLFGLETGARLPQRLSCSPTRLSTPHRCPGTCRTTAIHGGTGIRRILSATATIFPR